ncbi:hypothetical protein Hdeb2414_s0073g00774731 [Helianthus debilis subsp. tardiflorus]
MNDPDETNFDSPKQPDETEICFVNSISSKPKCFAGPVSRRSPLRAQDAKSNIRTRNSFSFTLLTKTTETLEPFSVIGDHESSKHRNDQAAIPVIILCGR